MQLLDNTSQPTYQVPHVSETDSILVQRAKHDSRAFAPLYERYRDDVLRYALRWLGEQEEAADATQQTFINALAGLPRFQDTNDSFRRWLFRIARNEIVDRRRQNARRREYALEGAGSIADTAETPEELAMLIDDRVLAHALLMRLTPEQRQSCALRCAGMSHREAAAMLGKSEMAVRASYSRGLAALRALMAETDHQRRW